MSSGRSWEWSTFQMLEGSVPAMKTNHSLQRAMAKLAFAQRIAGWEVPRQLSGNPYSL